MRNSNIFKIELKRAFKSRKFTIALLAGMIICLWHYVQYVLPMAQTQDFQNDMYYPSTVFAVYYISDSGSAAFWNILL